MEEKMLIDIETINEEENTQPYEKGEMFKQTEEELKNLFENKDIKNLLEN